MTNEQIISNAAQQLAEAGAIKYTGRVYKARDAAGQVIELKETEAIHTYNAWRALGFQVQKGQKAVAKLTIWKHATKTDDETGEEPAPVEEIRATVEITPRTVPEKTFIGETITGKGWRILFDADTQRTRVCFDAAPSDAARAAVEKAGFYFSAALNSYNKKLTFKAHRAAVALSGELAALYA